MKAFDARAEAHDFFLSGECSWREGAKVAHSSTCDEQTKALEWAYDVALEHAIEVVTRGGHLQATKLLTDYVSSVRGSRRNG